MTREEFVRGYMERSGITDYRLDGERVYEDDEYYMLALPCKCGEDECQGWAMIPPSSREWHLWNENGGDGTRAKTGTEAMKMDMAFRRDSGSHRNGEDCEAG
jgi:hypothetical protein